jgi:hypothetical protein
VLVEFRAVLKVLGSVPVACSRSARRLELVDSG